jgi:2-oxo-4-hydroxy-4-carboxy-5-ureidoimidazoline decarboxylase
VTLAELNAASRDAFVGAVGWVFEHSPWVAERAWERRPFASVAILHETMTRVVADADRHEQLALLRAHPDLGTRLRTAESRSSESRSGGPSGPPTTDNASAPPITAASAREQSGAGLDRLTRDQLDRLDELNGAYRDRFAFPFLFAVTGSTPARIIAALESRLPRTYDEELLEALRQVARIARFRLEGLLDS